MLYSKPLSAEDAMTKLVEVAKTAFGGQTVNWSLATAVDGLLASGTANSADQTSSDPKLQVVFAAIRGKAHVWAVDARINSPDKWIGKRSAISPSPIASINQCSISRIAAARRRVPLYPAFTKP